jgi:hypothetical protein
MYSCFGSNSKEILQSDISRCRLYTDIASMSVSISLDPVPTTLCPSRLASLRALRPFFKPTTEPDLWLLKREPCRARKASSKKVFVTWKESFGKIYFETLLLAFVEWCAVVYFYISNVGYLDNWHSSFNNQSDLSQNSWIFGDFNIFLHLQIIRFFWETVFDRDSNTMFLVIYL